MNIIYCTDIHGSFTKVYNLLRETVADVYIISGDLIDMAFYSLDQSIEYYETQNMFYAMRREDGEKNLLLEEYANYILGKKNTNDFTKRKIEYYLRATETAKSTMIKKYQILNNIFSQKSHTRIITIPGNYDMDLEQTALKGNNLHLKSIEIKNNKISGYGGAGIRTPGFPEKYLVKYNGKSEKDAESELFRFLKKESPDIIMVHHPPYGILDSINSLGSWGSTSLRTYCDNHAVTTCLSGHIHEDWGIHYSENTLYMNPSNFGEVLTPRGEVSEGGFFFEFILEDGNIPIVSFNKLVEDRVFNVAEYRREGDFYREKILDKKRYHSLKEINTYDENIERYNQIPELRMIRDIRNFFRIHQTKQSEERIENLKEALLHLGNLSGHVALDLVGSVNIGMAQDSSDVDAVLYLKDRNSCSDNFDTCDFAQEVTDRIREFLKEKHGFEVIDFINLDIVEDSIESENYDCELTQRFAAYRSFCRPINYYIIAPIEDKLNTNITFRKEVEENMRAYLRILGETADIRKSFDKYITRLKTMGITIPKPMMKRIEALLQKKI